MSGTMDGPGAQEKKANIVKRLWQKSGLNIFFILLAVKGALPTTIALAAYESHQYAGVYTTLGYLVAIISHLSLAIQPRAKFLQSLLVSLLFSCTGAAMALLQIQCVVAAHTVPSATEGGSSGEQQTVAFDTSACTVSAVFLFFWVFVANAVKAARPQMTLPVIQFVIFVIVASVYAPSFANMAAGISFVRRLLTTFLTGYGIAAGVSLFVLPVTSRTNVTKQMGGLTKLFKASIATHGAYMATVHSSQKGEASKEQIASAAKLKATIIATNELLGKIKLELSFARKELAYGKLGPDEFSQVFEMLRQINQPVMGMSTFLGIVKSLREHRETLADLPDTEQTLDAISKLESEEWDTVIKLSRDAYMEYQKALFLGLEHIAYQLELEKRPQPKKGQTDVEQNGGSSPKPGEAGFAMYLKSEVKKFQTDRAEVIQDWAASKDLTLPKHFWPTQNEKPDLSRYETTAARQALNQHQLYLVLYMNFLNYSVGQAILQLVEYADSLVDNGTLAKKRIINPGIRRVRKLFENAFKQGDADETMATEANGGSNIYLGDGLNKQKDPEHLPPTNWYEKSTDRIRRIPAFFASEPCSFAFRVAVATMSIGIVAYLRQSRTFFLEERGMWAMIMTAISMDPHAGQGIFGFVARVGGTAFAMVVAIVIWYMCDHKHAAILVIFCLYMACWVLFMIKVPQYAVIAMISSITVVLIIGYELQVEVIGQAAATSNGQEFYPVELLGPYRLATVSIGLFVAFIWTYFPYPITTHGALRRDIGSTLYILANYYSCVHTTLDARLRLGPAINDLPQNHPVKKLDHAREKAFGKALLMLNRLREYHRFTKFEPPFGGKFPSDTYDELISSIRNVFTYLALITYSSKAFIQEPQGQTPEDIEEEARWLQDFRAYAADAKVTSHELTTNMCLLSAAIRNSQPLPPYLQAPRPFAVSERMEEIDPNLLSVQHFAHPCYAAFAVGEVASAFVTVEMGKITRLIKELVGEVDFSFHVVSTADDGSSTTSTLWDMDTSKKGINGNGSDKKKGE